MCGIIGFIADQKNQNLINNLTNSLSHRGPDKSDTAIIEYNDMYLHLGSSRLSITGLEDGDMPMTDSENNSLIFNGEIYGLDYLNHKLKNKLNSKSDTRHLFNFLKEKNPNMLSEINGMFAFAFYDSKRKKLILGRDKHGIKPLYYGSNKKYKLFFSSEMKPLLTQEILDKKLSPDSIDNYLMLGGLDAFSMVFEGVKSLNPGHFLEFDHNFQRELKYFNNDYESSNDISGNFEDIFKETLNDQLNAEVPVNLLLSGGIDSTLIATYAKKILNRDVTTYTLGYEDKKYDESLFAKKIANELGLHLNTFMFDRSKNPELIEEIITKLPGPIADPSIVPSYFLSKQVSNYTKVVITGDGADEIFGGYEWYRAAKISKILPNAFLPFAKILIKYFHSNEDNYLSNLDKLSIFQTGQNQNLLIKLLLWQNYQPYLDLGKQIQFYSNYFQNLDLEIGNSLDDMRAIDFQNYLYTNILKKSDTSSMLNSLEIRPIFLDDRIIRFSNEHKFNSYFSVFQTKKFLKSELSRKYPNYNFRQKHGFAHDFGDWPLKIAKEYLVKNWNDIEQVNMMINYFEKNKSSNYLLSRYLWRYYSLFRWLDINKVSI